jgi:hypothetical protein
MAAPIIALALAASGRISSPIRGRSLWLGNCNAAVGMPNAMGAPPLPRTRLPTMLRALEPEVETTPPPLDPRNPVKTMGDAAKLLADKVTEYRTSSDGWDEETKASKRAEMVEQYQGVFVPGAGFVLANLVVYIAFFVGTSAAVQLGGIDFDDAKEWILRTTNNTPWAVNTVGRINPQLGNFAVVVLVCDLLFPLILAASLALSGSTTEALRSFLLARGLDSKGATEKLEAALSKMRQGDSDR